MFIFNHYPLHRNEYSAKEQLVPGQTVIPLWIHCQAKIGMWHFGQIWKCEYK